jgi:hypothetical protein
VASHQESLHSHDAVSVLTEGETFAAASLDPHLFRSLIHVGDDPIPGNALQSGVSRALTA